MLLELLSSMSTIWIGRLDCSNPSECLVVWKGDVSEAYRLMHPLWQVTQAVTVDGQRYVDCCNVLGGRASPRLWHTFMPLVLWVAVFNYCIITHTYLYVDDSFNFEREGSLHWYAPYHKYLALSLVSLLSLWRDLCIPHEEKNNSSRWCFLSLV